MFKEAIVVSGGDKENLKTLLGIDHEEQLVVGVDGGALHLLQKGIHVDVAIGDFDSINHQQLDLLKKKVGVVVELPSEKDVTDTEAALEYIIDHYDVDRIKMFGLFGGRIDHMISNLWIAYHPHLQAVVPKITLLDDKNTLSFYRPGLYQLRKEAKKKYLSFISMTAITNLKLENVKYPLAGQDYSYPIALVSNEFKAETMTFSFDSGLLAVIQSRD